LAFKSPNQTDAVVLTNGTESRSLMAPTSSVHQVLPVTWPPETLTLHVTTIFAVCVITFEHRSGECYSGFVQSTDSCFTWISSVKIRHVISNENTFAVFLLNYL